MEVTTSPNTPAATTVTTTTTAAAAAALAPASCSSASSTSTCSSAMPVASSSTTAVASPAAVVAAAIAKCHSAAAAATGSGSLASSSSASSCSATPLAQSLPQLLSTSSTNASIEFCKQDDVNNLSLASGPSEGQRSLSGAPSASSSPILSPQGKIFGRNANGTMIATSRPSNEAEVQLYRVLQRASLLAYYDTLLEMGGDDVQQLYDAGEEEFLEIMALVGMASKPLHVRRLQKALHEWANNPALFQGHMLPQLGLCETPTKPALVFNPDATPALPSRSKFSSAVSTFQPAHVPALPTPAPSAQLLSQIAAAPVLLPVLAPGQSPTPSPHLVLPPASPAVVSGTAHSVASPAAVSVSTAAHQVSSSSPQLTPVLTDLQVQRIAVCAAKIARQLPQREPRAQTSKKRTTRELEQVIAMAEHDPRRLDEIRKYSAIYGRFDCKRRPEKPLTLHEVCVNEAAAQLCRNPQTIWLLTRRDELFPLARQIVKDAGFGHSASIARYGNLLSQLPAQQAGGAGAGAGAGVVGGVGGASCPAAPQRSDVDCESSDAAALPAKRQRLSSTEAAQLPMELNRETVEDSRYNLFAMYQKFAKPPFDLTEIAKFSLAKTADFEDNDSRFSFSNSSSSPPMPANGLESERSPLSCPGESLNLTETVDLTASGVQVISAAGEHIIAVANPALAMSPTLNEVLKRNATSPEV